MSTSIGSWESVLEIVRRVYTNNLPLHYTDEYLDVICNIIGMFLGQTTNFHVVRTRVALDEPICTFDDKILLSETLIAYCINQAPRLPVTKISYVKNFNIFDSLTNIKMVERPPQVQYPFCEPADCINSEISIEENARLQIVIRIVLMVAHWYQHHRRKIPFNTHKGFTDIEFADETRAPVSNARRLDI